MDINLSEEHRLLAASLRRFIETEFYPHEDLVERERQVPKELFEELKQKSIAQGFYALNMPEEHGGGGVDYLTLAVAEREFGRPNTGLSHACARPANILRNCRDDQIETYLRPTIRGERHDCFALTEPGAGSDARSITTKAVKDGPDYIINGTKQFISWADMADYIIVFTVTGVDQTPKGERKRFTAFFVDKDTPGVSVVTMPCISTRGYNPNMIYFENVRVSSKQILGEEGQGFNFANDWLYWGRVMLAAHCVGRGERVIDMAADWAATRKAFGKTIGEFQGTSFKIADMAMELKLAELMVWNCAWKIDQGTLIREEASMCNLFASEMLGRLTDNAVQIFGGMGMMEEFSIQRFWRDARIERIWEGTSEIHRDIIARDTLARFRK